MGDWPEAFLNVPGNRLPARSRPERPTDPGASVGGATGSALGLAGLLLAVSIGIVLAWPRLGARLARLLGIPRSAILVLALERPD
jgi:hypothetical protein